MKTGQFMTKVSLGVAFAWTVVLTMPSASYAFSEQRYDYQNEDFDGTVWDYYRGYFSNESLSSIQVTPPAFTGLDTKDFVAMRERKSSWSDSNERPDF